LFRKKAKQLDEEALIKIERHRSSQDSRKFYKGLNDVRLPFKPLKYLIKNKAAGVDSIAAELLQNGRPNLVDALHAVI
jgi:hypothetical protein